MEAIAGKRDGETDREEHLHLDDERGESRGHPQLDAEEQESELTDADREAVQRDVAPGHRRRADEEHHRHRGQEKAQRGERERRNLDERDLDRNERVAPTVTTARRGGEIARGKVSFQGGDFAGARRMLCDVAVRRWPA